MNAIETKNISDICVTCGMCCDGTLFDRASIKGEADIKVVESLGMEIHNVKDAVFFKQPCICFDKSCTVYNKTRPLACSNFLCDPIKNFEKGEISLEQAHNQINRALYLKIAMLKEAKHFENLATLNWFELLESLDPILEESKPKDLKKYGKLVLLYASFRMAKKVIYSLPPKK
jgi:uncharacterized protein